MKIDLDLGYLGIVGQGRRSKVKCQKMCFLLLLYGQSQRSGSRSKVWVKLISRGSISGTQRSSAAKSNNHHFKFKVIVCVFVISGCRRIIARMRSMAFDV